MTKILCLETATEICSVCLSLDGQTVALHENTDGNQHSQILTLLIKDAMDEAGLALRDLDAVAVSRGPGSYTSLRVGASVAKGICYALGKPLMAIDTLRGLAVPVLEMEKESDFLVAPLIDARRMEVFGAIFDSELKTILEPQPIIIHDKTFEVFLTQNKRLVLTGNGSVKCKGVFPHPNVVFFDGRCSAANLSKLAFAYFQNKDFQDVAYFEPTYIKPPNITAPAQKT